jgi:hypothetical protein
MVEKVICPKTLVEKVLEKRIQQVCKYLLLALGEAAEMMENDANKSLDRP